MYRSEIIRYYFHLAIERNSLIRASRVAVLVGIILNLINHPEILSGNFSGLNLGIMVLVFLVPFFVSAYSSILSRSKIKPGEISRIDGILKCNNCKKTNFHIHIGQATEECPQCKTDTRWKISRIFNSSPSDNDMIKSLALFARHNPQPLLRTDSSGKVLSSNPAASILFDMEDINGANINSLLLQANEINLKELIDKNEIEELQVNIKERHYNLLFKGVSRLNNVHVYGNDITEIVMAEIKIKQQAIEINQSIQYASLIQKSMLPDRETLNKIFPKSCVFYRPKNVVSGDFYWAFETGNLKIVTVADCTGHGVPGAFMSMMGISLLNDIVQLENITEPDKILNALRERLIMSLSSGSGVGDGMDMALIAIDTVNNTLSFSGAYNPLLIYRNGDLITLEADRMPVGEHVVETGSFTLRREKVISGDRLFLFSDGYQDQFGGEKNKKLTLNGLKRIIIDSEHIPFENLSENIRATFDNWIKDNEQIDDVLVMAIEIQ